MEINAKKRAEELTGGEESVPVSKKNNGKYKAL